ncbi:hypothetical protein LTR85_009056 [Meristemomyces frigidus]|nr:hypothetical protein LTR85_009056 [Meristemomyces frigidus]
MVATRKSLPAKEAADENDTPTAELTKAQKAHLKKLNINANPSLIVGKTSQTVDAKNTYHWRGSVYEVTGKEPEEWLQQQPERYKKRQSAFSEAPDDEGTVISSTKSKKRKQMFGIDGADDERPAKKSKKPAPKGYAYKPVMEEEQPDPMYTSRVFDYTRVGGQEPMSCSQARELARQRGYVTDALPQSVIDRGRGLVAAEKVVNLAKINEKIVRLGQKYLQIKKEMEDLDGYRGMQTAPKNAQTAPKRTRTASKTIQRDVAHSTPASINPKDMSSPDVIITRVVELQCHDTPNALASPFASKPLTQSTPKKVFKKRDRTALSDLPATNKDGKPLRWSIDAEKLKADGGRAEDAISFSRLEGESKAAKRRRVQRELNLVRSWQLQEDGDEQEIAQ